MRRRCSHGYENAAAFDELHKAFRREHDVETPTARTEAGLYGALAEQVCASQKIWKHYNPPLKGTAREMREWQTGIMGRAFFRDSVDTNAITKIIRAETAVDGLFYRAVAELQKRKPARRLKAA